MESVSNIETQGNEFSLQKSHMIITFIVCFLSLMSFGIWSSVLPYTMNSIKHTFQLTSSQIGALSSYFIIGNIVGALFGGWCSDKIGRKKTIIYNLIFASIFMALLSTATSYNQFAILITLGALGVGTIYIVPNVLISEITSDRYRTIALATIMVGFMLGAILTAFTASYLVEQYGWQSLYQLCLSPVIIAIIAYFFACESPSWLKFKVKQEKVNKSSKVDLKIFIKDKLVLRMTILWIICSGFLQFGFYGVSAWLPVFFTDGMKIPYKEMTSVMILTYMVSIISKFISGYSADKLGPKKIFVFGTIGTAIMLTTLVSFHSKFDGTTLIVIFSLLYGIPFGILATYVTQSFPTSIRGTAVGGTLTIGGFASPLAPLMVGHFADTHSISFGMIFLGVTYLLSGLIALFFIKDRLYNPNSVN